MKFKFNLRWMLVFVGMIAGLLAAVTQVGMTYGEFVVEENGLVTNQDGLVGGALRLAYVGDEFFGDWSFECKMMNVENASLVDLKPNARTRFRYRVQSLGPLKKQEPCAFFLTRTLGIDPDDIVGYVHFKRGTEVVINGRQ